MKANKDKESWEPFSGACGNAGSKLRNAETPTWDLPSLGFSLPPARSTRENEKRDMTVSEGGFRLPGVMSFCCAPVARFVADENYPGHLIYAQMALTRSPFFDRCFISGVHVYFQAALKCLLDSAT